LNTRCLTVFITHYGQHVGSLEDELGAAAVGNAHMGHAHMGHDSVLFLYKLRAGRVEGSFGVNVARLAGVPPAVARQAAAISLALESAK